MKKAFKIGCLSVLGILVFLFILTLFLPDPPVEKDSDISRPEKAASEEPKQTTNSKVDTSADESDYFKQIVERNKKLQDEWNLPENANLKQLLKTLPVSETLEHVTETCKGRPSRESVEYARKTLEVRQMIALGRVDVEDLIMAEVNAGPNSLWRSYDKCVVEVQGKVYRATFSGEIEFEVWHRKIVVGILTCEFPESQYNDLHSMEPNTFVRIKGRLCLIPASSKMSFYQLNYCSFVD